MSSGIWCDLLEGGVEKSTLGPSEILGLDKAKARSKSHMLRATLNNAQQIILRQSKSHILRAAVTEGIPHLKSASQRLKK
jgi:hypothetical protein